MPSTLFFISLICLLFCSESIKLSFNSQGEFKILQLTDLHYETMIDGLKTAEVEKKLISYEKPDFISLTGDVHSGWKFVDMPLNYCLGWRVIAEPIEHHGIPWGFAMGNHDSQGALTPREILRFLKKEFAHSMTEEGPLDVEGASNFYIPIYSRRDPDRVAAVMWFVDSGSEVCRGDKHSYACIETSQFNWYLNTSADIAKKHGIGGKPVPAVMFFHIPQWEWIDVYNTQPVLGVKGEAVSCPVLNTGLVNVTRRAGDVRAIFVGHDHNSDYGGRTPEGLLLAYGRKTGYGCYGPADGMKHGGRVILLKEDGPAPEWLATWIRDESGAIVSQPTHSPGPTPDQTRCPAI